MTKSELVDAVARATDMSKAAAGRAVDATLETISTTLEHGDQVTLIGFGTFSVKDRPERQGRDPRTGEPLTIEAHRVPAFHAGKGLKDAVRG